MDDGLRLAEIGRRGRQRLASSCHASTLMVQKPSVAILSSGKIAYPMQRPVGALWKGVEARGEGSGRLAVLGSGRMADDEWLDREDNAKILDFVLRWLSPDSQIRLYDLDAEEPDVKSITGCQTRRHSRASSQLSAGGRGATEGLHDLRRCAVQAGHEPDTRGCAVVR